MKSRLERSKFKGVFTLLCFCPKLCACWVNVYFIENNLVLGLSIRVSVTYMGGGEGGEPGHAILPLISDLNQEVLPGPVGSTATWW